jgi:hypothetical protein
MLTVQSELKKWQSEVKDLACEDKVDWVHIVCSRFILSKSGRIDHFHSEAQEFWVGFVRYTSSCPKDQLWKQISHVFSSNLGSQRITIFEQI